MKTRTVQLGEVCELVMGQSPPGSSYNTAGDGLPFFQGKVDFGDLYPKPRVFCNQPSHVAEPNDILISVRAPVGPTNLTRERSCIGRGLAALRPREELDMKFLLYFLRHYEPRLAAIGQGSTFAAINRDDLEEIDIPLPSLADQQRIAGQLEQADRLRRTCRYALELTDTFLPAAFLQLFGDPVRNTKGWPVRSTLEIGDVQGGLLLNAKRSELPLKKPFLRVANVQRGFIELSEVKQIGLTDTEFRRTVLQKDDLLLVEGNGNPAEVGRAARWNGSIPDCVHQNHLIRVRSSPKMVLPVFLLALLNSQRGMDYYLKHGRTTSGLVTISTGLVSNFPALVPPLPQQQQFAALVERVERLRSVHRESLRQSEHVFHSLLQQDFSPGA